MAASAGLRTVHPVIRFEDRYGSLGSNPTPELVVKVEREHYSVAKKDDPEFLTWLEEKAPEVVLRKRHALRSMRYLRELVFQTLMTPRLKGVSLAEKHVCAFYMPYYLYWAHYLSLPTPPDYQSPTSDEAYDDHIRAMVHARNDISDEEPRCVNIHGLRLHERV